MQTREPGSSDGEPGSGGAAIVSAVWSLLRLTALATVAAALFVPAANAAPRMTPADRAAISTLIDHFVKDAVLRENLPAAWQLAGPDMRGGTTRTAWDAGTGVTVASYPAKGTSFRDAWTGHLVSPTVADLALILHPKPGSGYDETADTVEVRKIDGRWLVDIFYGTATFRSGSSHRGSCGTANCAISGPGDFGPGGSGSAVGNNNARIRSFWLWVVLGAIGAAIVLTPVGIWARLKRRERRAWAAYSDAHRHAG
jgi:hypothetical protein